MKITIGNESKTSVRVEFGTTDDIRFVESNAGSSLRIPPQKKEPTQRTQLKLIRTIVRSAKERSVKVVSVDWGMISVGIPESKIAQFAEHLASHAVAAGYDFTVFKTQESKRKIENIIFTNVPEKNVNEISAAIKNGVAMGEVINEMRTIMNTSAGDLTPEHLADAARTQCSKLPKIKVTVFDEKRIQKEKMGALWAVGKGSTHKPRFIQIEYSGGAKNDAPIVFVGKGITFDSGGLNLKPSSGGSLNEMHLDMSGGAAVIGALHILAKKGVKKNVIGLIPAAENMISSTSYRPGDIITSHSGKTIEVLNTDAEGRLVLADALSYAITHFKPKLIVDVATLTGAALIALGQNASAFFVRPDNRAPEIMEIAEDVGEYMWPLPMWDEYEYMVRSDRADVANIPSDGSRWGGVINGAMFLKEFVGKTVPWMHIDMAPRMDSTGRDALGKGATGEPIRFLVRLAEIFK